MSGWNSRGFEIGNTLDRRSYPAPRRQRSGPPPIGAGSALTQPIGSDIGRTRVFPWRLAETANSRSTVSTPRLVGNVVVLQIMWLQGVFAEPATDAFEIGYSLGPVTETSVALTVARPYTVLTELLDPMNGVPNTVGSGFPGVPATLPARGISVPMGLIVMERECAITMSVVNPGANVQGWYGYVNVMENLSLAALAGYIPSV